MNGKVQFSAPGYGVSDCGRNINCFAGKDDELVVAASADHGLYIWSLPSDQKVAGDQINNQPLVVLQGHKDSIFSVRFNQRSDTLASAGVERTIKLWTPIGKQQEMF